MNKPVDESEVREKQPLAKSPNSTGSATFSVCDSNDVEACTKAYEEEIIAASTTMLPQQEALFIELMLEEKAASPTNTKCFTKAQLKAIGRVMAERTGTQFDESYLRGKYHRLRNDWKLYRELRENYTSVGFDAQTGAIVASEEQWEHWLTKNIDYRKFQKRGLGHYSELTRLFGNSTATGDYGRDDGQSPADSNEEREVERQFRGRCPDLGGSSRKSGKRAVNDSGCDSGGSSSKKTKSNSFELFVNAWTSRQDKLEEPKEDPYSLPLCMDVLNEMNVPDDIFLKAIQYLNIPNNRIVFMKCTPERRIMLLWSLP